jgi:teichuronic acid exporter
MNLKHRTTTALFWSVSERLGLQVVQFTISIILARLLLPDQFGLIGMLALFMAISQSILDSGFGASLIRKKDATHIDECSIFYFNILIGIILAGFLGLAAPLIANFYSQPILVPLTRVLSINIIINSFGLIQSTLWSKTLISRHRSKSVSQQLSFLGWSV